MAGRSEKSERWLVVVAEKWLQVAGLPLIGEHPGEESTQEVILLRCELIWFVVSWEGSCEGGLQ